MAVASLVFGLITLLLVIIPGVNLVAFIPGLTGIILGAIALKQLKERGQPGSVATVGLVTSVIGTVVSLIICVSCFACLGYVPYQMFKEAQELGKPGATMDDRQEQMKKMIEEAQKRGQQL